jgi:hypothetical protein
MNSSNPHEEPVQRALLPALLFEDDLARTLRLPEAVVASAAPSGYFGPTLLVAGRLAVLRRDFLETMTLRAASRDLALKEVLPCSARSVGLHRDSDGGAR